MSPMEATERAKAMREGEIISLAQVEVHSLGEFRVWLESLNAYDREYAYEVNHIDHRLYLRRWK